MMNSLSLQIFQALLAQDAPYFIQVSSGAGSVEFIYRDRELRLLSGPALVSWQDVILADDATFHLRPGTMPSPGAGELIPATSIAPVMDNLDARPPATPPARATASPKPAILVGASAKADMKTSIYGRSTIALDVDLIRSISKEVLPKKRAGITIPLSTSQAEPFWIGRSSECDLVIEDSSVSRRHCHLTFRNGLIQLRDNDSSNGCYVNGGRVTHSVVEPDQPFYVGKVLCAVKLSSE